MKESKTILKEWALEGEKLHQNLRRGIPVPGFLILNANYTTLKLAII